jgi:hypothetical protein
MSNKIYSTAIILLFSMSSLAQWSLTGNAGTNPSTNFLGTTDNQKVIFKTNNLPRLSMGGSFGANEGIVTIGDIDPNTSPYGSPLQIRGANHTGIDLISPPNVIGGWHNQIRFYGPASLRHVITDDYTTGNLVIQTQVDIASGASNIVDIRGKVKIASGPPATMPTPVGYSLYVGDGILSERVKVSLKSTADWSDYVFEKDYRLIPLDSVEAFVNQNKHLPGIPSALEMVNNGNDLGKTDADLLRKIEELTLYTIALNKEKNLLRVQLQELQQNQSRNNDDEMLVKELLGRVKKLEQDLTNKGN